MQPSLDSLILTPDELHAAKEQVRRMAYLKWQAAGCPPNEALRFWLEAELEWIEYRYIPDRYPPDEVAMRRK